MNKLQKITSILIIIFFASCNKNENDIEFNKKVLTEILPSIIDSICVDARIFTIPPPKYGEAIFDKEGRYLGIDATKATTEEIQNLKDWKKNISNLKKDSSKIIIAFDPKILPYEKEYEKIVDKNFPKFTLRKIKTDKTKEYFLDFKNIKLKGRFKLKNINDFDRKYI
ncbi:MAG: hypothetical protein RLZZ540_2693, partial [Bacteroidota bacterium]